MLPDFICVGTGRSGTSWLYEVLLEHPEVATARNIKETQFFNANFEKGVEWYEKFFEDAAGAKAVGEISNRYIFDPKVAPRIKKLIPGAKIIICLRNPYDRIQSVYSFKLREGALDCSFEEALRKDPALVEENRYHSLVKPYFDLFGKDKVFILYYDDLVADPKRLCVEIFRFLGVDEGFVPSVVDKKVNAAIVPRFPAAAPVTKGIARMLRGAGLYGLLTWAKRSDLIKGIFFKGYSYKSEDLVTQAAKALIDRVVIPEIRLLEALTGRRLDGWKG